MMFEKVGLTHYTAGLIVPLIAAVILRDASGGLREKYPDLMIRNEAAKTILIVGDVRRL